MFFMSPFFVDSFGFHAYTNMKKSVRWKAAKEARQDDLYELVGVADFDGFIGPLASRERRIGQTQASQHRRPTKQKLEFV